jgi:hypothetical protein
MGLSRTFAALTAFVLASSGAGATPRATDAKPFIDDTAEVTNVLDAFDADDPFDVQLSVAYATRIKSAKIRRESELRQAGLAQGRFTATNENIASFAQTTHSLNLQAEAGLWHDLALRVKLPIVLSDSRALSDLDGSSKNPERLTQGDGAALFSVPFNSPSRSGLDWLGFELAWGITNQRRTPASPTWLASLEVRLPIGDPLHACNAGAAIACRNVFADPASATAQQDTGRTPGLNRGMTTLIARTAVSRRYGDVEPYGQFSVLADFPGSGSDFATQNTQAGVILNRPPVIGTVVSGVEFTTIEEREHGRRLVFDLQGKAAYVSTGRDYSELFDALGSSRASTLATPSPGAYTDNGSGGSMPRTSAGNVYFTGITDIAAHISLAGRLALRWQAGPYVAFALGTSLEWVQSHAITGGDECNTMVTAASLEEAANCKRQSTATAYKTTGIPNPNYRPSVDAPGRRFIVDDTLVTDLWANLSLLF